MGLPTTSMFSLIEVIGRPNLPRGAGSQTLTETHEVPASTFSTLKLRSLFIADYQLLLADSPSTRQTAIVPEGTDIANSGHLRRCHLYCAPLLQRRASEQKPTIHKLLICFSVFIPALPRTEFPPKKLKLELQLQST